MAMDPTNFNFKLVESGVTDVSKIPFAAGQYIVLDSGKAYYDPSTGTTTGDRIELSPDLSGFLKKSISDKLVTDVTLTDNGDNTLTAVVKKVGTDGTAVADQSYTFSIVTDAAVTEGSTKPVQSGAVYTAIQNAQQAASADVTVLDVAEDSTDAAALATLTSAKAGDMAICRHVIAGQSAQHTAYMAKATEDGLAWAALDGNYNADNIIFDSDLILTANIGVQTLGSASSKTLSTTGKSLTQVLSMITAKQEKPTITANPAVTTKISNNGTPATAPIAVEGGTTITPKWAATLSAGSYKYGPATGITAQSWSITDTKSNTSTDASGTFSPFVIAAGETYKITATATHGAGPIAHTNLDEEYKAGNSLFDETPGATSVIIPAGSKSAASPAITAWQQGYYIGTIADGAKVIDSATIRSLTKKRNGNITNETVTFTVPVGAAQVIIATPAGKTGMTGVLNTTVNANMTESFVKSTVKVAGADGSTTSDYAKDYNVWVFKPATPYGSTASLSITIKA
mgnify:CR=1 FL=1